MHGSRTATKETGELGLEVAPLPACGALHGFGDHHGQNVVVVGGGCPQFSLVNSLLDHPGPWY